MNITIVGAGAMGCLYASMLVRAGLKVWLLEKNKVRIETIRSRGLIVEEEGKELRIPFETITSDPAAIGMADIMIIFVKAYDTTEAVKAAVPCLSEETTVLTLQNGLGNVESIANVVREKQILAGTTAHGANIVSDGHIRHAGIGETVIGAVRSSSKLQTQTIKELFESSGISTTISEDINSVLWGKLVINIGINPLTAIMQIKNGQILDNPYLVNLMHSTVGEGITVAERLGIPLPFPEPIKKVEDVCRATAENISSMHQDILTGRKTEIAYINGAVVAYGRKVNVPTPVNSTLTHIVQSIEQIKKPV